MRLAGRTRGLGLEQHAVADSKTSLCVCVCVANGVALWTSSLGLSLINLKPPCYVEYRARLNRISGYIFCPELDGEAAASSTCATPVVGGAIRTMPTKPYIKWHAIVEGPAFCPFKSAVTLYLPA